MMTTTAIIHVLDGGRPFEDRVCQLVRLRDGRPAAIWRGLAFPIGPGDSIDISGPGVPPAECLPAAAPLPQTGRGPRWGLVEGIEEAWVLVAGSVAERDAVASRLRGAGLAVLRSGAWLGDPADGLEPDWFVRIARPTDAAPLSATIEAILGPRAAAPPSAGEAAEDLRRRLVKSELERARMEAAALRAEVERLKTGATAAALADRVARLEADLARAEEQLAQRQPATTPPAEASPTTQAAPRLARRIQEEVATVLQALLPGIRLLRDSLTVASVEFRDRSGFYRALRELAESGARLPPAWKKVRGAEEWWERHVSTGEDDSGRAYARPLPGGAGWDVLLSDKGNQERDMAWLRKTGR